MPATGLGRSLRRIHVAVGRAVQRDEGQRPGRADEIPDGLGVGCTRHLHQDLIRALGLNDRLERAGAVDAVLDDALDRRHGARIRVADGLGGGVGYRLRLVGDGVAALEVEPQIRLERLREPAVDVAQHHELGAGDVDVDGERAKDQDQEGDEIFARGGMIAGRPGRRATGRQRDGAACDGPRSRLPYPSSPALILAASAAPIPGTAATCSTGASRTLLAEPKTRSSAARRLGPTPGRSSKAE